MADGSLDYPLPPYPGAPTVKNPNPIGSPVIIATPAPPISNDTTPAPIPAQVAPAAQPVEAAPPATPKSSRVADDDPYGKIATGITMSENPKGPADQINYGRTSSATGNGQFIEGTWRRMLNQYHPDMTAGKSDKDVLAMRGDSDLSHEMTTNYAKENASILANAGLDVNPGTLYLAHTVGPGGAVKILQANPNTPVSATLGEAAIIANPSWANMTGGQLYQSRQRLMTQNMMAAGRTQDRLSEALGGNSSNDTQSQLEKLLGPSSNPQPTNAPPAVVAPNGTPPPAATPAPPTPLPSIPPKPGGVPDTFNGQQIMKYPDGTFSYVDNRTPAPATPDAGPNPNRQTQAGLEQVLGPAQTPPGQGGAGAFDAQGNPRSVVAPTTPATSGPTPSITDRIVANAGPAAASIGKAAAEGYNQPFLTPEGQALADKYIPGPVQTVLGQAGLPLRVLHGIGGAVTEGAYQGGEAIAPGAGRDAVGLLTAAGAAAAGSPHPSGTQGMGLTGNKPIPVIAEGRLLNKDIPEQRLSPALYPSATPQMIQDEAAARQLNPKLAATNDAHVNATNLEAAKDVVDTKMDPAVSQRLFNTQSAKDPALYAKSLTTSDGKALDPVKFNDWLNNLHKEFDNPPPTTIPQPAAGTIRMYGVDPAHPQATGMITDNINYAKSWAKKAGQAPEDVHYVDVDANNPAMKLKDPADPNKGYQPFTASQDLQDKMSPTTLTNTSQTANITPKDLQQLENIRRVVNAQKQLEDVTAGAHPHLDATLEKNIGTTPIGRAIAAGPGPDKSSGYWPAAFGLGGAADLASLYHQGLGGYGLGSLGAAYALNKGVRAGQAVAAKTIGPSVEAANDLAKQQLMRNSFQTPTEFKPGSVIPQTSRKFAP